MFQTEMEKRQALIELLAIPDSPDLHRGHHLTLEGRADRYLILQRLAASFIQHHLMEQEERRGWESSAELRLFNNHTAA